MNWEIFSYGSGDFLRMVFTAIASIFGNDDYTQALSVAALLGFIGVFLKTAFDQKGMANLKWFLVMIMFYMIALVPKQTVVITDRITPANSAVVNNVPIGLAATAGFFSHVGDYMARSFETIFSLPSEARYTENGFLFSHRVLEASRTMSITDGRTYQNLINFYKDCVHEGLIHRRFTEDELLNSTNLITFFSSRVAENAAMFTYQNSTGVESIEICRSGFTAHLRPDLETLNGDILQNGVIAFVPQAGSTAAAVAKMNSDMAPAVQAMTGISSTPKDIVLQNAVANTIADGRLAMAEELEATASMQKYVLVKAELERKTTYQAMGKIANHMLPMLRTVFEAFLYAIFPIIAMMAILVPVKVSLAYVKGLVWVNLWAPLYAVLHFFGTYYAQGSLTEIVSLNGGGFSMYANTKMMAYLAENVATIGYLASSLPIIAWLLVSSSGAMAASFANRALQGYDSSISNAANDAAGGTNMTYQGTSMKVTNEGLMQSNHDNMFGQSITDHANGSQTVVNPMSSTQFDTSQTNAIMQREQDSLTQAQSTMEQTTFKSAEANMAALSQVQSAQSALSNNQGLAQTFKQNEANEVDMSIASQDQLAHHVSEATGVKQEDAERAIAYVRGDVGGGMIVSGSVGGRAEGATSETESEDFKKALEYLSSDNFTEKVQTSLQASHDTAVQYGLSTNEVSVDSMQSALNTQKSATLEKSNAVTEVDEAKHELSRAEELRDKFEMNNTDGVLNDISSITGMSKPEVGQVINMAGRGDIAAQNEWQALLNSYVDEHPQPDKADFDKRQEFEQKSYELLEVFSGESVRVRGVAANNEAMLDSSFAVRGQSQDDIKEVVSRTHSTIEESRNNPHLVASDDNQVSNNINNRRDELRNKGDAQSEKVEREIELGDKSATVGDVVNKVKNYIGK